MQANFQSSEFNHTRMEVRDTFKLINDGLIHNHSHPSKKAILLVGLTGTGKTTLAKLITGDNSRLMSVPVENNSNPSNESSDICSDDSSGSGSECEVTEPYYEYNIKDNDDDSIGLDITNSKTLYPKIYVDQSNDEVIIDCPGFADTRSANHETAVAVFMKRIFSWVTQVKIILVVNHSAVQWTGSRCEFTRLLEFVSKLLKDLSLFHTSIGMIVTKVTNEVVIDNHMIAQIGKFLSTLRSELIEKQSENSNIILMNCLLKRNKSNHYRNIAIFRKCYISGSLELIPEIQAEKENIIKMLFTKLKYANVTESNVGFPISDRSGSLVSKMCLEIKINVVRQFENLNKKFRQYYKNLIDQARNYDELRDILQKDKNCFDSSELDQTVDLESQLKKFFDILSANEIHTYLNPDAMFYNLINQLTPLRLLQNLSNDNSIKFDPNWSSIVPNLVQHLVSLLNWYNFIVTAFERMSQNDVQAIKSDLGLEQKNWASLKYYFSTELQMPVDQKIMRKLTLEMYEQKSLVDIIKIISEPVKGRQIQSDTDKCEIVIEGYFVRISDVEKFISEYGNKPLSAIYVFAQYTVFFDSSINKDGSELLLSVIAPKWEIINQQSISLNGTDAANIAYTVAKDGKAGQPGGQAGTFFGVGYDFVNGRCLIISTNGGTGGNGQDGENGRNGHGDIVLENIRKHLKSNKIPDDFTYNEIKYRIYYSKSKKSKNLEIQIASGPVSKPGFHGGKQGLGGLNGITSNIIALNGSQTVILLNSQGANGKPGKGGKGGTGEIVNSKAVYDVYDNMIIDSLDDPDCSMVAVSNYEYTFADFIKGYAKPDAKDGFDNHSGNSIEPKMTVHLIHPIVSKYRRFLFEKITDPERVNPQSSYKVFLNYLNSNEEIKKIMDLIDLVYEFIALEELNQKRSGIPELTYLYDMLLILIENCADKERNNASETFLVIANYLYAAILSRKLNIKSGFSENFVVNVNVFVDQIKDQIGTFIDLNQEVNIKNFQKLYNDDIAKKEKEGNDFVTEQFKNEMDKINIIIKIAVSDILKEIQFFLKKLETKKEKIAEDMIKMEELFAIRAMFAGLETLANVLTFFLPQGAMIGNIIKAGVNIGMKTFNIEPTRTIHLQDESEKLLLFQENYLKDYAKKVNAMILHIKNFITSSPEVKNALANVNEAVLQMTNNNISLLEIHKNCENMIKDIKTKYNITDESLDRLGKSLKMAYSGAADFYNLAMEKAASQNKAKKIMAELDVKIAKLYDHENKIDNYFHENLKKLISLLDSINTESKDASAIALEISRYGIKNILKAMRVMIKSFTSDFKANEDLVSCTVSLENLMMTTMNVYDQLQTYNDQRNLGNLITNINTVTASGVHTGDDRLDTAIRQLDYILISNTIQNQYLRALHAFQQLIFPFAPMFLAKLQSPTDFSTRNKTTDIQLVISKLNKLQNIFRDQDSSIIGDYDEPLITNTFNEENPFYVWDAATNGQAINNLLSGDEIALKADVSYSVFNAVKFKDIRLKLLSTDNNQKELDDKLENFNIRMTHMGNSRYRCEDKVFTIANKPQIFLYSFAVDEQRVPLTSNNSFNKITKGDILLSPYALWKFQLMNRPPNPTDLSQFQGKIKLVLVGGGQYVEKGSLIFQTNLEEFYDFDTQNIEVDHESLDCFF